MFGRAAAFALAMLAVLTLVASGGFHELLHADERAVPAVQSLTQTSTLSADARVAAISPDKSPAQHKAPQHGCSGHCAAHAADQAPILVSMPIPPTTEAGWRLDRGGARQAYPSGGQDRPPRA